MNKLKNYIQSAVYSIMHNKAYALFCIIGTAFTFVFIAIILQLVYDVTASKPPFVNAERLIVLSSFRDVKGNDIGGIPSQSVSWFMEKIKSKENYYMYYSSTGEVAVNEACKMFAFAFVNGGFWKINQFDIVEGRAFTEQECLNQDAYVVLREDVANDLFKAMQAVGQKIEIQGRDYLVIGVVREYSTYAIQSDGIWVPYVFNNFCPRGFGYYDLGILFPRDVPVRQAKENIAVAIREYWRDRNMEVDITPDELYTFREDRMDGFGHNLYSYGIPVAIILLLVIPAINIVTLNMANVDNYVTEIALKRALGAGIFDSFVQVATEIFILVIVGTILGVCLIFPIVNGMSELFFNGMDLIKSLNYQVLLCGVFPLSLIFTLLSGGIPAYMIAKNNIAVTLKGGAK
ncbi:ABC transporter permease [Butyricimonas hominis]|uniref:ABC transporter permease n=1 Tax=Butyricimonas hominis TaxID=2763032 RepID=UPI003511BC43